jgi:hypothetical protein
MILDILQPKSNSLLCPKCERPLEDHDEDRCKRKMSRRFFLGAATGVVLAVAIPTSKAISNKLHAGILSPLPSSWFPGGRYMLSAKDGYFVSSLRDFGVNKSEVDYLTGMGFDVYLTNDEQTAKFEYYKRQKELARIINEERFGALGTEDHLARMHPDDYRKIHESAMPDIEHREVMSEKTRQVILSTTDTSYTSAPKDFIKKQLEARGFVVA